MTLRNLAAASLAALALAACGDDDNDNNTKPITPDTPATPEACKAMKCVYQTEGDFKGSFVAKNEKGEPIAVWDAKGNQTHKLGKDGKLHKIENKPEPGTTAGEFDLSGEGVNEPIAQNVRGGGIYIRGTKSKHDLKKAPNADLSPIGQFALETDWDKSLQNIVIAKTLDAKGNEIGAIGVDNVGVDTTKGNAHYNAQGDVFPALTGVNSVVNTASTIVKEAKPTIDMVVKEGKAGDFLENGSLDYKFDGPSTKDNWKNEEKEVKTTGSWDGTDPIRLYGNNAWYDKNLNGSTKTNNFYRIKNYGMVINQNLLKQDGTKGILDGQASPTDVEFDTLDYVQFGRVSANVSSLNDAGPEYGFPGLQFADRAQHVSNAVSADGDPAATDFYFARGNNPTTAENIKALPSNMIAYHGNALVFGLDNKFHGGKSAKPNAHNKALPHSFGTVNIDKTKQTLLGGRGNFVYAQFDPAKSAVDGSIYNVWLVGTYMPHFDASGKPDGGFYPVDPSKDGGFGDTASGAGTGLKPSTDVKDVFPVKDDLIQFEGKVAGNTIRGDAMNYAAQKGKFAGAFFGKNAEEMSGVITANTQKYGEADETPHWGAVFGAKVVKAATGEVLPALGGGNTSWLHEEKGSR